MHVYMYRVSLSFFIRALDFFRLASSASQPASSSTRGSKRGTERIPKRRGNQERRPDGSPYDRRHSGGRGGRVSWSRACVRVVLRRRAIGRRAGFARASGRSETGLYLRLLIFCEERYCCCCQSYNYCCCPTKKCKPNLYHRLLLSLDMIEVLKHSASTVS